MTHPERTTPPTLRVQTMRAVAAAAVALTLLTGCTTQTLTPLDVTGVQRLTTAERFSLTSDGSYHGWWDQKPLPGQPTNLVIFSTKQNKVIQTIGAPPTLTAKNWAFLRSPRWAPDVILVLDPTRNRVMVSFATDPTGNPTDGNVDMTTIGGYEGWWNATPVDGDATGLPNETVQISTRTNKVIDGYNRTTKSTNISYTVHADPAWPKNSIVIIDTATNKVIDSFPVDDKGIPLH